MSGSLADLGLEGKWKTKNYTTSAPTILELASSGADGLTIRIPDFQITCEANLTARIIRPLAPLYRPV
jgi:hypothetical protein